MRTITVLLPLASLLITETEEAYSTDREILAARGFNLTTDEIDHETVWSDGFPRVLRSVDLPCSFAVCPRCDGHGSILTPSIGEHAFSSEEFTEAFCDDEDRAAYFTRGGKYDVTCPTCLGKNVVPSPDRDAIKRSNDPLLGFALAFYDRELEAERREVAERRREVAYGY